MKFKFTGGMSDEVSWVEHFYHETVVVNNGVAETESKQTAELLEQSGFVPYDKWEKEQAEAEAARKEAEAKRAADYQKQREEDEKNARETFERDSNLSKTERKELDKLVAQNEGAKPAVPVEQSVESSVVVNAGANGDGAANAGGE